jgi:hypothetical protein
VGEVIKALGQLDCPATTLSTLYTVPASTSAVLSSLVIANRTAASKTFRVSVRVAGAADDPKQYLYYDVTISKNDTFAATLGVTLGAGDIVSVYASATGLSFSAFGTEVS